MGIAGVSIVIAAANVAAASTFYSFQIRNQVRIRKTDLVMRLYATWDSLQFQQTFHTRLYEHFEFLYDEITRRALAVQSAFAAGETGVVGACRSA
jgi:hypothetical protein